MNESPLALRGKALSAAALALLVFGVASGCAVDDGRDGGPSGSSGGTNPGASGGTGSVAGGAGGSSSGGVGSVASGGAASGGTGSVAGGTGGSGSTSTCDKPGVLFCEDFEAHPAGAFPGTPWTLTAVGLDGAIVVDAATPAHSGSQSAKVDSSGNYQLFLSLTGAPVFPSPSPALYVRTYIRLSEPMTDGHNTYFKAGAAGASSSNNETRVGVMKEMLMINQPDGDRGFLSNQNVWTDSLPGVVFPVGTWTCVEGFFDPPNTTVSIAVNDTDVPDLHVTDWQQDPLGALHFGFEGYAGPETVLWYDDIVVSTQPIGCQ